MWERGGGEANPAAGLRFESAGTAEEVAHPIPGAELEAKSSEGKDGATYAAEPPGVTRDGHSEVAWWARSSSERCSTRPTEGSTPSGGPTHRAMIGASVSSWARRGEAFRRAPN
eukprot:3622530-Prymnesium_polylepis.1